MVDLPPPHHSPIIGDYNVSHYRPTYRRYDKHYNPIISTICGPDNENRNETQNWG